MAANTTGGETIHDAIDAGTASIALLAGLGLASASGLAFEIALTRVFAVTQFYHFAFLTVSLALLGFGASGSALAAYPQLGRGGARRWAALAAVQGVTTIAAYVVVNRLPFDSFAIAWDRRQLAYLVAFYLVLAVPFFFGGAVVGAMLQDAGRVYGLGSNRVYGASLAGSGLGCLVAVGVLASLGAEATILLAGAMALIGAAVLQPSPRRRPSLVAAVGVAVALVAVAVSVPGPLEMRLSPYKDLSAALRYPTSAIVATSWDGGTRIDHLESEGIRSLPGLSLTYTGVPPPQDGITFDGDDLSPIPLVRPEDAAFATSMLAAAPFVLRPGADALVLEPRGGLDVLVALANGADTVTVAEPYRDAIAAVRRRAGNIYDDSRVRVVAADTRTFVERTEEHFDVVDLALTAPYRPVASGAYSLGEDYRMTVEAFEAYLGVLRPGGLLAAARWVQVPPSEETRLIATAAEAVRRSGGDPAAAIVALRSYRNVIVVVRPGGFAAGDLMTIRDFAGRLRFDLVAAPDLTPDETNRFNAVPDERYSALAAAALSSPNPDLYAAYAFDIAPATDDRPFFGHFFTWAQAADVLATLGHTWQPFGGAGYFVLLALLALAVLAAVVLILAPLALHRRRTGRGGAGLRWWTVGYFSLLGAGFLFVEIPLVQRYILLLGRPASAFAVVLFAVLVASGIGSLVSPRIPWRRGAMLLAVVALVCPFVVTWVTPAILQLPAAVRVAAGVALIAPLGLLMGIMFPWGLAYLERRADHLVAWAWGINGTVSVIAAVAAAVLALSFGFTAVLVLGAACYGAAAALARPPQSSPARVSGTNATCSRLSPITSPLASSVNRHSV